nr:vWA domain-containing protein [Ruegeria sp. Ofav3-42]
MNKPTLFGGEEREGGVSGAVDVLDGNPQQGRNNYLVRLFGALIPAYRGVASLVFRRPYLGNNPYLKEIKVKAKCIAAHGDNWYPEKSHIRPSLFSENNSIYIAIDVSGSMNGGRLQNAKSAISAFLEGLKGSRNSVEIVAWSESVKASTRRLKAGDADYDALIAFVNGLTAEGGTNFDAAVSQAGGFFAAAESRTLSNSGYLGGGISQALTGTGPVTEVPRRVVLFLTDGAPSNIGSADDAAATLAAIGGVETYAFNIDTPDTTYTAKLDNTSSDGVPVVSGGNPSAIKDALSGAFLSHVDMNPSHILRDLIVDTSSGGSGSAADIGDSFRAVADTLYDEGFGLSIVWDADKTRDDFKQEIERHIDGYVYVDRQTGKWEIKLVRDDFDVENLPRFGDGGIGIVEWLEASTPEQWELPNQITVRYSKRSSGDYGSVTLTNLAALRATGVINNEEVDYPGISEYGVGSRVCQRDLVARTTPLMTGAFWAKYLPADLNIGSEIVVADAAMGIKPTVIRITHTEDSDGRDNRVLVRFAQDKSAIVNEALVADEEEVFVETRALPSSPRFVEEMPYYVLVGEFGQSDIDGELEREPDLGQFHATCKRPSGNHVDAQVTVSSDNGANWIDAHQIDFAPVATLQTSLSRAADDLTADIDAVDGLGGIEAGSLCQIGSEYLRVDKFEVNGQLVTVTFGRACLDTVPEQHAAGQKVIFWDGVAESDDTRFLASEIIDIRLRPQTSTDVLEIDDAETDQVTFASRAIRPYPPGKFTADGEYTDGRLFGGSVDLAWAHRDRTAQTTGDPEDHTHGNIGPEAGVTYQVRVREYTSANALISTLIDINVGSATSQTVAPEPSASAAYLTFEVASQRGSYESWQVPKIKMKTTARTTEGGADRTTEGGQKRSLE